MRWDLDLGIHEDQQRGGHRRELGCLAGGVRLRGKGAGERGGRKRRTRARGGLPVMATGVTEKVAEWRVLATAAEQGRRPREASCDGADGGGGPRLGRCRESGEARWKGGEENRAETTVREAVGFWVRSQAGFKRTEKREGKRGEPDAYRRMGWPAVNLRRSRTWSRGAGERDPGGWRRRGWGSCGWGFRSQGFQRNGEREIRIREE